MLAILLAFTLAIPCALFSFSLSESVIQQKLAQPMPAWAMQQIQTDLAPFLHEGASRESIDETLQAIYSMPRGQSSQFVWFEICNNAITFSTATEDPNDARIVHFVSFFEEMAKVLKFPDVKILVSIWDNFDSPLFLHQCKGAVFSICKRSTNQKVILLPEVRNYEYYEGTRQAVLDSLSQFPWEQRESIAFWRGNTTGGYYHYYEWDYKPRPQLVLFSKAHPELIDARFTGTYYLEKNIESMFKDLDLFDHWGYPTGHLGYKYQVAIDGNSFASSLKWQMLSGSTILKNDSDFIEWFYRGLKPNVHYIPFRIDCTDLEEKILWLKRNDVQARAIAQNAHRFAMNNLTLEDIAIYYHHLLGEFSKLQEAQRKY